MSTMSEEVLTLKWKITNFLFFLLSNVKELKSPKIKLPNLDCQWYVTLIRKEKDKLRAGFMSCNESRDFLSQRIEEDSLFTLSCSLGISDANGKLLAFMDRTDMHIDFGWFRFMDAAELIENMSDMENNVIQIRCQLFDKTNKTQSVTCEAETEIQVTEHVFDWKISILPIPDWSKSFECQIQDGETNPISFHILLTTQDNKVFMNIRVPERQNLPEVCQMKVSIICKEGVNVSSKMSYFSLHSAPFETCIEKDQLESEDYSSSACSFELKCIVYVPNGSSNCKLVHYSY